MNLGTIIIGIICIALCAMPFILTSINKKKKQKKILNTLNDLAKRNNSTIIQHEICAYYAIGIDESKKTVSFILNNGDTTEEQFINLSKIKSCDIVNIKKPVNKKNELSRLYLKLNPIDKNETHHNLEFFNTDVNYQIHNEIQSIENWNTTINNIVNKE